MNGDEFLKDLHKIRVQMDRERKKMGLTLAEYMKRQRAKWPKDIRIVPAEAVFPHLALTKR